MDSILLITIKQASTDLFTINCYELHTNVKLNWNHTFPKLDKVKQLFLIGDKNVKTSLHVHSGIIYR